MRSEDWLLVRDSIVKGDMAAFEKVYHVLWSRLFSIAYNYTRHKENAQEIVQEVFVKLWIKRDDLKEVNDIYAFATRSVQFRVFDFFDKQKVEAHYKHHVVKEGTNSIDNAHHLAEYNETLNVIERELNVLPCTTRDVFRLSRFEQLSNKEIASKLKISLKTVEYHITQSLKHLRLRLGSFLSFIAALLVAS